MHRSDLRISGFFGWRLSRSVRDDDRSPLVSGKIDSWESGWRTDGVSVGLFQAGISGKTDNSILCAGAGWERSDGSPGALLAFRAYLRDFFEMPVNVRSIQGGSVLDEDKNYGSI